MRRPISMIITLVVTAASALLTGCSAGAGTSPATVVMIIRLFDPAQGPLRAGLARPTAVYAAGVTDDAEGQRTRETATPLAEALGTSMNVDFGRGDEKKLAKEVAGRPGATLVAWQHGGIPEIADAVPHVTPKPPDEWPDERFDVVWILTKSPDGWRFSQLPELVLPQDQPEVIES